MENLRRKRDYRPETSPDKDLTNVPVQAALAGETASKMSELKFKKLNPRTRKINLLDKNVKVA